MGRFLGMSKPLALLLALAGLSQAGEYKVSLAVAPVLLGGGDIPFDLVVPLQTTLAEVLSWEASMIPGVKVADPGPLASVLEAKGWSARRELGGDEVEDVRMAARQQDAEASLVVRALHSPGTVEWKAALAYRVGTVDRAAYVEGVAREDDFLLAARRQALSFFDSLGVPVPPVARQAVNDRGRVPWESLLEYARGVRDQQAGRTEDALRHLRDAYRRAPLLPALQVRLKKLERDNPGK